MGNGIAAKSGAYPGRLPSFPPTVAGTPTGTETVLVVAGNGEGAKGKELTQGDKIALGVGLSIPLLGILVSVLIWLYPPRRYFSNRGSVMAWLRGTVSEEAT